MKSYKAFLFDLNGTMIDDMEYHINAWYTLLNEMGFPISYEDTKKECYGKNHELLERIFPGKFSEAEKISMSTAKEDRYRTAYLPHLALMPGLVEFLQMAKSKDIKMAIGSASIQGNVDFVVEGLQLQQYLDAIVTADHVSISKPHPETFLQCAQQLNIAPADCLVFEDAPKGTIAAKNAGMDCVVITSMHQPHEFDEENVIRFIKDYTEIPDVLQIQEQRTLC